MDVPFDLRWYKVCFENKGTVVVYENGEVDKNVNVTLNFNNKTIIHIPYGETKCVLYKLNKDFTYTWNFKYSLNMSKILETSQEEIVPINKTYYVRKLGTATLKPNVDSYAVPELSGVIVKNILVFFGWSGIVLLLREIKKFVTGK